MKQTRNGATTLDPWAMPAVRAVKDKESTPFSIVLRDLERLARSEAISIAVVGGLAAIHHGDARETNDADILVSQADLDSLLQCASRYGFSVKWRSKTGWHTLEHKRTGIEVNIVPEGGRARDHAPTTIPSPKEVGVRTFGFADLGGWIELKLSSGRQKDIAHVVEVLKCTSARRIPAIQKRLAAKHSTLIASFKETLALARSEREQERGRRG